MENLQKALIYKIVCKTDPDKECYIGHTTDFIKRRNNHKFCCTNNESRYHDYFVYNFIRNHGGWDNWDMIVLEEFFYNNKQEVSRRERYYIDNAPNGTLNCNIASRTSKEWIEDNKEYIKEYKHYYYELNKNRIKQYYQDNKEKLINYGKYRYYTKVKKMN